MRCLHHLHLFLSTAAILISPYVGTASKPESNNDLLISGFPSFVSWFKANGGTLLSSVTIGYEPPLGGNTDLKIRGMIATALIPADTLLMYTPASLILSSSGDTDCSQIEETAKELKLGTLSKWHTYFKFDDSSGSHVPSQWDRSNGPGRAMDELQGLLPAGETHRHISWYQEVCKGGNEMSDLDWRALMITLTRSCDLGLAPMYDLMNHHNGLINTKLTVDAKGGLSVISLTDIPVNAPIYNTYARSGIESTIDVFITYGFVENYPQLWRWNDEKLVQLTKDDQNHAHHRYGIDTMADDNDDRNDRLHFEPNSDHYEVLVISPTLAALSPTKKLVYPLGNSQRSMEEWGEQINSHHANLRSSHVNDLHDSAQAKLNALPTTIEQDELLIPDEKRRLEKVKKVRRVDVNKADAIQAIEFRLAFKKALRLTAEVAKKEKFLVDSEEL